MYIQTIFLLFIVRSYGVTSALCNKAANRGLCSVHALVHSNTFEFINGFQWTPLKWWGYIYLKHQVRVLCQTQQLVLYSFPKIPNFACCWLGWDLMLLPQGPDGISHQIPQCFCKQSVSVTWPWPPEKLPPPLQQMKLENAGLHNEGAL